MASRRSKLRSAPIAKGEKAWHTGRELINSYRKPLAECEPNELWRGELDIELTILDSLTKQLDGVVKKLEAIGKEDARIQRIMSIRSPASVRERRKSWLPASTKILKLRTCTYKSNQQSCYERTNCKTQISACEHRDKLTRFFALEHSTILEL